MIGSLSHSKLIGLSKWIVLLISKSIYMVKFDSYIEIVNEKYSRLVARLYACGIAEKYKEEIMQWVVYMTVRLGLSETTINNYARYAHAFLLWLQENDIILEASEAVESNPIEKWMSVLYLDRGNSPATRNGKLAALKSYFEWRERFSRGKNLARSLRSAKQQKPIPRRFTDAQLTRLFNATDRKTVQGCRDYAMLLFMYSTGARRSEVASLTIEQLILRKEVGYVRLYGKGARERIVSFNQQTVDALQSWLVMRDSLNFVLDHDALWISLRGANRGHMLNHDMVNKLMKRTAKNAGIPDSEAWAHKMRSTCATALYDSGLDLLEIRKFLGHARLETTDRYIDVSDRQLKARIPAERVEALLTPNNVTSMPRYAKRHLSRRCVKSSR